MIDEIGQIIARVRKENGLSLRAFASLCIKADTGKPLSYAAVSEIERGLRSPDTQTLAAIASHPLMEKYDLAPYREGRSVKDFRTATEAHENVRNLSEEMLLLLIKKLCEEDISNKGLIEVVVIATEEIRIRSKKEN